MFKGLKASKLWKGRGITVTNVPKHKLLHTITLGAQDEWHHKLTLLKGPRYKKSGHSKVPSNLCADDRKRNGKRTEKGIVGKSPATARDFSL